MSAENENGSSNPTTSLRLPKDVTALVNKAVTITGRTKTRIICDCIRSELGKLAGKRIEVQKPLPVVN